MSLDLIVLAIAGYLLFQNQKTNTTTPSSSTGIRDLLTKIPLIGSIFAAKKPNVLIEKVKLWNELMDKIEDEDTKKQLNALFPSLNTKVKV